MELMTRSHSVRINLNRSIIMHSTKLSNLNHHLFDRKSQDLFHICRKFCHQKLITIVLGHLWIVTNILSILTSVNNTLDINNRRRKAYVCEKNRVEWHRCEYRFPWNIRRLVTRIVAPKCVIDKLLLFLANTWRRLWILVHRPDKKQAPHHADEAKNVKNWWPRVLGE